jgi:hypothetical protein
MGTLKKFLKKTPAYSQTFRLFCVAGKLRQPFGQKGFAASGTSRSPQTVSAALDRVLAAIPGYSDTLVPPTTAIATRGLPRGDRWVINLQGRE